jgi:hypothetical protein
MDTNWIPAHIFFLKYFEELELELRFGESYLQYKKDIPLLIPNPAVPKKARSLKQTITKQ